MPALKAILTSLIRVTAAGRLGRLFDLAIENVGKWNIEILRHGQIVEQMELLKDKTDVALVEFGPLFGVEPVNGVVEAISLPSCGRPSFKGSFPRLASAVPL